MKDTTKRGSPLAAKITKIASLATKLSREKQSGTPAVWGEQLFSLLAGYLASGRDDVLGAAQEEAFEKGGRAARAEVTGLLEVLSATQVAPDDQRGMVLFAVPVLMFVDEKFRASGDLDDKTTLDKLAFSFEQLGITRKEASIGLVPYLFDAEETDVLEYSDVLKLSRAVLLAMLQNDISQAKPDQSWPETDADLRLLYLVGGYIDDAGVMPFSVPPDADDAQTDAIFSRLDEWSNAVAADVETLAGPGCVSAMVGMPAPFHEALRVGDHFYRDVDFQSTTDYGLRESEVTPDELLAVVRAHGSDGEMEEFRVSYVRADNAEFVGGAVFSRLSDSTVQETWDDLQSVLAKYGFARIDFSDELLEMESCECCGEPVFFEPETTDKPDPLWKGHTLH